MIQESEVIGVSEIPQLIEYGMALNDDFQKIENFLKDLSELAKKFPSHTFLVEDTDEKFSEIPISIFGERIF